MFFHNAAMAKSDRVQASPNKKAIFFKPPQTGSVRDTIWASFWLHLGSNLEPKSFKNACQNDFKTSWNNEARKNTVRRQSRPHGVAVAKMGPNAAQVKPKWSPMGPKWGAKWLPNAFQNRLIDPFHRRLPVSAISRLLWSSKNLPNRHRFLIKAGLPQ